MPFTSFQNPAMPSAIVSDFVVPVPLFAVTSLSLAQTFHLPPIGSSGLKAIVPVHDDVVSLSGMLVGPTRYLQKFALETMAEAARRGGLMGQVSGGASQGLVLITSMTIRTDMQVQSLTFGATAAQRDALSVAITMVHAPLPSGLGKLLDAASVAVGALADWGGN
jgi:hypothetical protein